MENFIDDSRPARTLFKFLNNDRLRVTIAFVTRQDFCLSVALVTRQVLLSLSQKSLIVMENNRVLHKRT